MNHFKTAGQHIRRSPYQSLSAILVMTLTFFISSVFILFAYGSGEILRWFETRPQVTAFFKDGTKTEQLEALKYKLNNTGSVSEMKYVSKEEALTIYKEQNKNDPLLLEMVTANILPASLEVSAKDLKLMNNIAGVLKEDPNVEEVVYQEDVISSLSTWTDALRKIGGALVIFMGIISFLVIMVIVGMKIALRKDEIEISRLIGASSWYIRLPFILEGVIYGVSGAIFGWISSYILLLYATPFMVSFLSGIPVFPISMVFMLSLLGLMTLSGAVIGIFGSYLAVKRYLR